MIEIVILLATFFSVLIFIYFLFYHFYLKRGISERIQNVSDDTNLSLDIYVDSEDISGLAISERELLQNYFNVIRSDHNPNSLSNRLLNAGYFSPRASHIFQIIRFSFSIVSFFIVYFVVRIIFPETANFTSIVAGLLVAGVSFMISNIVLERRGMRRQTEYRKTFPDFLDTLMVCLDAGMSIEAAFNRVTKEYLDSPKRDFGLHLAIMMLEVRSGRRLREALMNFSGRLVIEEARALAVLFRQSEEMGASVTKTLRIFSQDMRDRRIIRAEEKANTLPLKMLFPLSVFLFPISLLIVLVPIFISVVEVITSISPR